MPVWAKAARHHENEEATAFAGPLWGAHLSGGYAACAPESYGSRMRQGTVMTLGSPG